MKVGYSDFVKLCRVENSDEWCDWLAVRGDGVYVKEPPAGLEPAERAILSEHPTGNLNDPALVFPCDLASLKKFLEEQGVYGCIDPFDMADWIQEKNKLDTREKSQDVSPRAKTTYLNIIAALLDCIAGNLPNVKKHPSFSSEAKLIEAIDGHFRGYAGLSQSTLSRKFPEAKKSMEAQ
jgi:hypothetical protein